jgi:hypothetical protein
MHQGCFKDFSPGEQAGSRAPGPHFGDLKAPFKPVAGGRGNPPKRGSVGTPGPPSTAEADCAATFGGSTDGSTRGGQPARAPVSSRLRSAPQSLDRADLPWAELRPLRGLVGSDAGTLVVCNAAILVLLFRTPGCARVQMRRAPRIRHVVEAGAGTRGQHYSHHDCCEFHVGYDGEAGESRL